MNQLFNNCKVGIVAAPQLKDNGAAVVAEIDTKGYTHATFLLIAGAIDTTLDAKVQECDASGGTFADITSASITQLSATDDNKMAAIELELGGPRKRFLKPVITAGDGSTGCYLAAIVILSKAETAPTTATLAGLAELVKI